MADAGSGFSQRIPMILHAFIGSANRLIGRASNHLRYGFTVRNAVLYSAELNNALTHFSVDEVAVELVQFVQPEV